MDLVNKGSLPPLCSCGRGPVMLVSRPDSSRLNGSERYIVCLECALSAGNRFDFGVLKDQEALLRLQVHCLEIYSYFDSRYLVHWINHFALCPSKKAIWEILSKERIVHNSLSTFYEKIRLLSLEGYLREIAGISSMMEILRILDLYDPYLEEQISKILRAAKIESDHIVKRRNWN